MHFYIFVILNLYTSLENDYFNNDQILRGMIEECKMCKVCTLLRWLISCQQQHDFKHMIYIHRHWIVHILNFTRQHDDNMKFYRGLGLGCMHWLCQLLVCADEIENVYAHCVQKSLEWTLSIKVEKE